MFRRIRWRIAVPYVLLIVLTMTAITVYLSQYVRNTYLDALRKSMLTEASLLSDRLSSSPSQSRSPEGLDAEASRWAQTVDGRVTIIGSDGAVLGESHEDRSTMDNHLQRSEVQRALARGEGSSIRFSATLGYDMMYVAVPVSADGIVGGVVRLALPLTEIDSNMSRLHWAIVSATLITIVAAGGLAVIVAQRTTRPLRMLTRVVQRMADGDMNARLLPTTRDEVGELTTVFNQMSDRLRYTVGTLAGERGRLAAILSSMANGVIITDQDGTVRLLNPAAGRLLGITTEAAVGHSLAEVARDYRIISLWRLCQERSEEQMEPVELSPSGPWVQVIGTPLRDDDDSGCLLILQDLTRIRRLERVRRDFVSNLSHELRTPLASLRALAETLRDSALDDPPAARRFLDQMETEVDALTQIVEELLELSRIESGQVPLRMVPADLSEVVIPPVERLRAQADRAGLSLIVDMPSDMPQVLADVDRVQRVVTNLVHNAIKFTPPGGQAIVSANVAKDEVIISVKDTGVGIAAGDLPRIFERFYKGDRMRSGEGTGLGLAIAKHIVQAHGGQIRAESVEGQGSRFYFSLPSTAASGPKT